MKILNVLREINRGGFGVIEEVKCSDGKNYARKTFSPIPHSKITPELIEKFKKRFIREVETQKRLPKEYVIPIIYDDLKSDSPWFLMPLAEYDYTYEIDKCKTENRNPNGLSDILNSLEYIHNLGLVHRDLKPGNILYHEGVWKLSDLGLVTQDKDILSLSITSTDGLAYGTANYAAPEQISDFKHVDNRADIYSFGAILHDIFGAKGRTPYSNLKCAGDIGIIIDKCTKRDPKQRFKNVSSIRTRLLYLLSKNTTSKFSSTLQHQIENLDDLSNFDQAKFEDLIFYLKEDSSDITNLFRELKSDTLNHLFKIDKELFVELGLSYADWVENKSFVFDYCDVVIGFIHDIYKKTDNIDLKAKCVIAAAEMGNSHNRWFVMENVVKMANKEIEDGLALRLQIEIDIDSKIKLNFNRCVTQLNKNKSHYHDLIAEVL